VTSLQSEIETAFSRNLGLRNHALVSNVFPALKKFQIARTIRALCTQIRNDANCYITVLRNQKDKLKSQSRNYWPDPFPAGPSHTNG